MDDYSNSPFAIRLALGSETVSDTEAREQHVLPLRAGDICPSCQIGCLDYDGLLNLACPECGYSGGGGCYT